MLRSGKTKNGEGGIRTHGPDCSGHTLSRRAPSTTRTPLLIRKNTLALLNIIFKLNMREPGNMNYMIDIFYTDEEPTPFTAWFFKFLW